MKNKIVLIVGLGHLASRVKKLVEIKGYKVIQYSYDLFKPNDNNTSALDKITATLANIDLSSLSMAYVLSERDENNLEIVVAMMALNKDLPITTSLFNENVAPHLQEHILTFAFLTRRKFQRLFLLKRCTARSKGVSVIPRHRQFSS